jgi:type VI secretion system protein ImpB
MAKSFQHEKPPARINLFLEVQTGEAKEKVELPLRMLVTGDFSGKDSDVSVEDRDVININKDNFDRVLKSQDVNLEFNVENKIAGEGDMKVNLEIESMKDFSPDEVVKQIPALSKLMATRKLLNDMKNRLISSSEFRKKMESVIKDEAARNKLLEELKGVIPEASDEDEPAAEE